MAIGVIAPASNGSVWNTGHALPSIENHSAAQLRKREFEELLPVSKSEIEALKKHGNLSDAILLCQILIDQYKDIHALGTHAPTPLDGELKDLISSSESAFYKARDKFLAATGAMSRDSDDFFAALYTYMQYAGRILPENSPLLAAEHEKYASVLWAFN
ncbi:hypothetical protein AZH11_05495 [Pseudomonas simiae]|nr:hypothetical protein AZH11_05495 [Pseudomonas simiae]